MHLMEKIACNGLLKRIERPKYIVRNLLAFSLCGNVRGVRVETKGEKFLISAKTCIDRCWLVKIWAFQAFLALVGLKMAKNCNYFNQPKTKAIISNFESSITFSKYFPLISLQWEWFHPLRIWVCWQRCPSSSDSKEIMHSTWIF